MWYRIATFFYVGVLALTGLESVNIPLFFFMLIYNVVILIYRNEIIEYLRLTPALIIIDLILLGIVGYVGGPYGNPYLLYTFSPIFLSGFLYGYRGAFAVVSILGILLTIADCMNGYGIYHPVVNGEHLITPIIDMFVIGFMMAFLSELLKELETIKQSKQLLNLEFEKTMNTLRSSISFSQLSEREKQVLELSSKGRTVTDISEDLSISVNTVKTYLRRVNQKLDTSSKQQVVSEALRQEYELG
jgi:DNA-binding CsgD family transcriptional regulator